LWVPGKTKTLDTKEEQDETMIVLHIIQLIFAAAIVFGFFFAAAFIGLHDAEAQIRSQGKRGWIKRRREPVTYVPFDGDVPY
jgi:hypothetical protein